MTTRLHQVLGLTTTATEVQEVTLDKPVIGVKSGYLVSGDDASYVTTPAMPEAINLTVVTVTPSADGEIYLKDANTLEIYLEWKHQGYISASFGRLATRASLLIQGTICKVA
jgi:hypothetical protein